MSSDREPTATLREWWYDVANHVIWGYIYYDRKERFCDGTHIHTSSLMMSKETASKLKEDDTVMTRNSFYKLGKPSKTGVTLERAR